MNCCKRNGRQEVDEGDYPDYRKTQKERGCTDCICLLIFATFWIFVLTVAIFALVLGNPLRLIYGADSFGNICGWQNSQIDSPTGKRYPFTGLDLRERPYLFYLNAMNISHSLKICVKMCPNETIEDDGALNLFYQRTNISYCRYDFSHDLSGYNIGNLAGKMHMNEFNDLKNKDEQDGRGPCPKYPVFPSKSIIHRCVPKNVISLGKEVVQSVYSYVNSFDSFKLTCSDLMKSWREVLTMISIAIILSFITAFLIQFVASLVSYIILVVVSISLVFATAVLWWSYVDLKYELDSSPFSSLLQEKVKNQNTFLVFAVIATIFTIILLLIIFALRKRVALVVALFTEAGRLIRNMPSLLFQPIWTFFILILFSALWLIVLFAFTTAEYASKEEIRFNLPARQPVVTNDGVTFGTANLNYLTWISYKDNSWVYYMWYIHVFALIWTFEFILASHQMVIAGAVSQWYFSRDRKNLKNPIIKSIKSLTCHHIGSLAFGSFLIFLFKIPRLIITYIQTKLRDYQNNVLIDCILRCCSCTLWCMEKFLQYLNRNAYTIIAIQGTGFCESAGVALTTIVNNALKVTAINSVGDFILFLGKCSVTAITVFVGVLMMKDNSELNFYAVPIAVTSIFAYFIADTVISVFEMIIDSLFLCFCLDLEENDGTPGREYFAPPSLCALLTGSCEVDAAMTQLKSKNPEEEQDE